MPIFARLVLGAAGALAALAHYTWIAPITLPLEVGKTTTVRIGHGHKFPQSEEAINWRQLELFVLTPSGARVKLEPAATASTVTASFTVKDAGPHRIAFVQDRGVSSRTPRGVKPGGRDKNPDATQSTRTFRTAVAYAGTDNNAAEMASAKPIGLEFELTGEWSGGAWQVRLLKQGKAVDGASVEVFLAGSGQAVEAGKTGSGGRLTYRPATGTQGAAMFSVMLKDAAPAGAMYDAVNYETSLYVSW